MSIPTAAAPFLALARATLGPFATGDTLPCAVLASLLEAQAQGTGSLQLEENACQQLLHSGHARRANEDAGVTTPLMVLEALPSPCFVRRKSLLWRPQRPR